MAVIVSFHSPKYIPTVFLLLLLFLLKENIKM
jgi:hypothetical protein